jgi:hypothetical protein
VGANEVFTVVVTVLNIGSTNAHTIRLSYDGALVSGIIPVETNNAIHISTLTSGKSAEESIQLKTTNDVIAGNQAFVITLDYTDLYGGVYTSQRQFLINVLRSAEISYDTIEPPKEIAAGETFTLPANIFNVGKSILHNVTVNVTGAGLFPTSSVFLGDIAPGQAGNGQLSVFAGRLSMSEGQATDYGKTEGTYRIIYSDDSGEEHVIELVFIMEILEPVVDTAEGETEITAMPQFQWWVTLLVGLAIIAILVAAFVVTKMMRAVKMRG